MADGTRSRQSEFTLEKISAQLTSLQRKMRKQKIVDRSLSTQIPTTGGRQPPFVFFRYSKNQFFFSVFSLIFLVWLILRPSKPEFYLKEADIYQLDVTAPHLLNSSIQVTMVTMNPNKKVGVYHDQLQVYASYKGQQITLYTSLPPFYQGHEDSNLLTASLVGLGLPVAPSLGYEVGRDQTAGSLVLSLKVNGRLRWKVWTWVSGRYRFNVDCVAIIAFRPYVVFLIN
ncbi:NDR1/HIN1-like protein 26 [Macadamia integrifolia]|uniref:NDR1/HIN1-like protein 26 n=1 Tax=Macadamia integrifolia TaxID=60698 RepID=UPI001C4FE639|nr:NDR1/HIN1-like protein 26 [Macadamia integrifolia]